MRRTVFICINGIRSDPSDPQGWTDEFVTELNLRTSDHVQAEKFEYYCSALFRWKGQKRRAENLARRVNKYVVAGYRVVLIGHSNGCDLIARVLGMGVRVDTAHLFAPAAFEADFEAAIEQKLVRRIHIYGSPNDRALKAASITSKALRLIRLGYGSLGLRGAAFAAKFPDVVKDHSVPSYGHSTWFLPGVWIENTLAQVLHNDAEDRQS